MHTDINVQAICDSIYIFWDAINYLVCSPFLFCILYITSSRQESAQTFCHYIFELI